MMPQLPEIWDCDQGQPPQFASFLGKPVVRAWFHAPRFLVGFEDGQILAAKQIPAVGSAALEVRLCAFEPDFWQLLDRLPQTPFLSALRGATFQGLNGNILEFLDAAGVTWGARLNLDSVEGLSAKPEAHG